MRMYYKVIYINRKVSFISDQVATDIRRYLVGLFIIFTKTYLPFTHLVVKHGKHMTVMKNFFETVLSQLIKKIRINLLVQAYIIEQSLFYS